MLFAVGLVLALPPLIFRVVVVDLDMSMVFAPEQADMRAECHEGQYHGEIWHRDRFHAVHSVNTVRRKFIAWKEEVRLKRKCDLIGCRLKRGSK